MMMHVWIRRCLQLAVVLSWALSGVGWCGGNEDANAPVPDESRAWLIMGATLIDGTGRPAVEDSVIYIVNGRIRYAGPRAMMGPLPEAKVVDAAGKFVVPGIVDAHAHIDSLGGVPLQPDQQEIVRDYTPLAFLYHGVTTVLNMSAHDLDRVLEMREQARREPASLLPRIYTGAVGFTAANGWGSRHGGGLTVDSDVDDSLTRYRSLDVDLVKIIDEDGLGKAGVFPRIPAQHAVEIVSASKAAGLPVFIHATDEREYLSSIALGPRVIAHGLVTPQEPGSPIVRGLREKGIFVVPTIVLFESFYRVVDNPELLNDPQLRASVPDFVLDALRDPANIARVFARMDEVLEIDALDWGRAAVPDLEANVKRFVDAGIPIAVGTDGGGAVVHSFQGYNVPREMELLAQCCLDPLQTIVAASGNAARIMGAEEEFGTLTEGRSADLLVLNANPLADMRAIRDFDYLMLRGHLIRRQYLSYAAFVARRGAGH
ncbi:amidohydrolase family protein [Elongatibacter sediminis]|uniref:Amidohydrolase family protein n=1 Tax=Elongatibacter sediminis TaxID=3119006 RepID=A0AAW9REE6_9GAMM